MMLTSDAMLWACGSNGNGQLGDGTTNNNQSTPEQISSMSNVQTIAAGYYFSLILKKDGTLWACGWNLYGELGDGTMTERDTPIQMINMSNVQSMAAGKSHSLIIKKDGTLWACGWNGSGQLGTGVGDPSDHSTPVNISF
jgi:alpha-tubulin suppressor-like RCC1 family protein